jgi:hypothetical protein
MDEERARALLSKERHRLELLLTSVDADRVADGVAEDDTGRILPSRRTSATRTSATSRSPHDGRPGPPLYGFEKADRRVSCYDFYVCNTEFGPGVIRGRGVTGRAVREDPASRAWKGKADGDRVTRVQGQAGASGAGAAAGAVPG